MFGFGYLTKAALRKGCGSLGRRLGTGWFAVGFGLRRADIDGGGDRHELIGTVSADPFGYVVADFDYFAGDDGSDLSEDLGLFTGVAELGHGGVVFGFLFGFLSGDEACGHGTVYANSYYKRADGPDQRNPSG